jgi:hypothetical protein
VDRQKYQTKKGGGVLRVQGTCHGHPAECRDANYKGKVPLLPKVSMLPLTKEQLASQECVGRNARKQSPTRSKRIQVPATESANDTDQSGRRARVWRHVRRPWARGHEHQSK